MKPGPPTNLKVIDFTKESVTLSWLPPTDTGRGKIFGYLLEFQKAGEEEWTKVRRWQSPPFGLPPKPTSSLVTFSPTNRIAPNLCAGEPHSGLLPGNQV